MRVPRPPYLRCLGCCLFFSLALASAHAQPAPPPEVAPGYLLRQWDEADGLPLGGVRRVAQTPDGYLWLATGNGLVRFDGHTLTTFSTANTPALQSNDIRTLRVDDRGRLWAFTARLELVRYHKGSIESAYGPPGTRTSVLSKESGALRLVVAADTAWLATDDGVVQYVDGEWRPFAADQLQGRPWTLHRDTQHRLWVGMYKGHVYRVSADGHVKAFGPSEGLPSSDQIRGFVEDHAGRVWVRYRDGLYRPEDDGTFTRVIANTGGHDKRFSNLRVHPKTGADHVLVDARGWIPLDDVDLQQDQPGQRIQLPRGREARDRADGTYELVSLHLRAPLHHVASWPKWDRMGNEWTYAGTTAYRNREPIADLKTPISTLFLDDADNVWLASDRGFAQLRATPFRTPSWAQRPRTATALAQAADGTLWAALGRSIPHGFPTTHLVQWRDDALQGDPLNLAHRVRTDGPLMIPNKNYNRRVGPGDDVWGLYFDPAGALWAGTNFQPCQLQGTTCVVPHLAPIPANLYENVADMHHDRDGRFWMATKWGLLVGWPQGGGRYHWQRFTTEDGLPVLWLRTLLETQDGQVLVGTSGGGIVRIEHVVPPPNLAMDGQVQFGILDQSRGLPANMVGTLHEDDEGAIWAGLGDGSVCHVRGLAAGVPLGEASLACLSQDDGLSGGSVHQLVSDDYGRLWSATSQGVYWLDKADIAAFWAGEAGTVVPVHYTEEDGLPSRLISAVGQPVAIKAQDGTLWFATEGGITQIDPRHLDVPALPRPHVERIEAGGMPFDLRAPVVLPKGERDVRIQYTGVVFQHATDVQFRVRLVGYDKHWRDMGALRTASYTNLPPDTYTFEVQAGLAGQWSPSAQLHLTRPPLAWETRWFYGLIAGLAVLTLVGLWRYRVRHLQARQAMLETLVTERTAQIRQQASQLAQQAEALQQANTLKSRFLANISHEFRTPLTLTFGPLRDLLSGRYRLDPAARPMLERAQQNGHRLHRLINQLLDLSRIDAGYMALNRMPHDLAAFLRLRVAAFESLATEQGITLRADIPDVLPATFDAEKLETVLLNLLSNGFKFTPSGGTITVAAHGQPGGVARITVSDTGVGIAPEHVPHLFDRFYQADGSSTRTREGSGIGLALVQQLIQLHDGSVSADSVLGQGTTFTLTLPLHATSGDGAGLLPVDLPTPALVDQLRAPLPEGTDAAVPIADVADAERPVVLVVEDNADMRAYIRDHLDSYTVLEAADGQRGLEAATAHIPDLVLSDVMMPRLDGYALLDALKRDTRTSHIPIVLLTARADAESRIAGLVGGADDYLAKPFDGDELRARLANLIANRNALRALWSTNNSGDGAAASPEHPAMPAAEAAFVQRVTDYFEAHLHNAQLSVEDAAHTMHMSPRQLRRKLHALTRTSPRQLLRRLRIARSTQLLARGDLSVNEIAEQVGFGSATSFRRAFRDQHGVTPSAYVAATSS
ncbi:MAG: ATP-binding protein [Bacteroidota bacterium]